MASLFIIAGSGIGGLNGGTPFLVQIVNLFLFINYYFFILKKKKKKKKKIIEYY